MSMDTSMLNNELNNEDFKINQKNSEETGN
jgi:hypothetical protein